MTTTRTTCKKCNGTGYRPEVAHCDGGRCWSCYQDKPRVKSAAELEADAAWAAFNSPEAEASRRAAGRARKALRGMVLVGGEACAYA